MSPNPPVGAVPDSARILRVLLVEDSVDDALLLERHLRKGGFTPTLVRVETAEAMKIALETPAGMWDCVLADYNLPQFSAPEALQLLKNGGHDIPFIMMSGAVSEDTAVAAMRAGAHDYVSKENLTRLVPAIERELAEAVSRRHRRATERALQSSEERFHRIVEATPLALLISDAQGHVVYANQGVTQLFGYTQAEIESGALSLKRLFPNAPFAGRIKASESPGGASPDHLSEAEDERSAIDALMGLGQQGETRETECVSRDGEVIPVLLGAAILNPEAVDGDQQLAAFLVDLTEQKRSQDVLRRTEKLAAAGRLAASIAHEINNPLEAITNCIYLLQQLGLDELPSTYLAMAQRELDRVTHITTQTLRFYRQSTKPAKTDLRDLLDTVVALYEGRLRDNSIEIVRDFEETPSIVAYDGEIRQVLANFVGNALDAMSGAVSDKYKGDKSDDPESTPVYTGRLVLRTRMAQDWINGRKGVAITISDTGGGMSASTLQRIYEPFFSTKGITGTGLGLWVSHEIIVKHDGRVQVRSRQTAPTGTVFRLFLPLDSRTEARNL